MKILKIVKQSLNNFSVYIMNNEIIIIVKKILHAYNIAHK